jgi:mono/diheme cytochrome c family protein
MRILLSVTGAVAVVVVAIVTCLAQTKAPMPTDQDALIARGKYLATAADCSSCHGADLSGGKPIATPIGDVYASNITSDPTTGIGNWTEQHFADALRKGTAPGKGWLYPGMPYTSYTGLTDADVESLYAYVRSVDLVQHQVPQTELPFPFYRVAMFGWNSLFMHDGKPVGAVDAHGEAAERGRYLVEVLGHCTTCHTPRGVMMQEQSDKHLSGALVDGWQAPNITPDPSGLGNWSDAQIVQFLKQGHNGIAVANGDMGLAVERSLSRLPDEDINDMVAYLRQIPPVQTASSGHGLIGAPQIDVDALEEPIVGWKSLTNGDTTDGARLYQGACATCHGFEGTGGAGPNIVKLSTVSAATPDDLVQAIAHGVNRTVHGQTVLMPAFQNDLNSQQIASLATYVRKTFGGLQEPPLDPKQIDTILAGKSKPNLLIGNAAILAWCAIGLVVLILLSVLARQLGRNRRNSLTPNAVHLS